MLYDDHNETPIEVPMSNVSELCFSQVTYVRNNETLIKMENLIVFTSSCIR